MGYDAFSWDDVVVRKLDGPPEPGFDCGNDEQNAFLYDRAWNDQEELISVTYKYYVFGIFAAYATVLMDGLSLSFRERGMRVPYETVGAAKLAQLGVDRRFQGRGLGEWIISHIISVARTVSSEVGCRYLTVDARPGLEAWYQRRTFKRNRLMQERRVRFAVEGKRDPSKLATSMRTDIRDWDLPLRLAGKLN